ncbi:MAG: serine/threonine protein kinase [Xanthomonadales bacterium]|nr:serine/threonine protein kinase [Xanthomonadales bacterium]
MSDYARLRAAVEAAWEAPAERRDAVLAEALHDDPPLLAQARTLIAADAPAVAHFDALGARAVHDAEAELARRQLVGRAYGAYRVLRRLGSGGMGEVWLGERCDGQFERKVAIKLLAPGIAAEWTAPRLAAERRILASLDHPGIARLLDAGIDAEGQPWLVEEYVEGRGWQQAIAELPQAGRVRLLLAVCAAVAHAHARLVAHGDLKPGNLLVDAQGQPRLIDFGIARWLDTADAVPAAATPAWSAPEQRAQAPVTAATDVHALGLLLHHACDGARAADGAPLPLARRLGDLARITAQALAADPAQRHASVAAFAEDLERWLAHRPLAAQAVPARRRVALFLRRHPWACATAAAVLASWLALTLQIAAQSRRLAAERDRAAAVTAMLVDLYSAADPSRAQGRETTLAELLAPAQARLAARALDPETRAQLQRVLARTWQALGAHAAAAPLIEAALAHYRALPGASKELAATLVQAGENARLAGRLDAATAAFDEALGIYRALAGAGSADSLDTLAKRARLAILRGEPAVARADLEAALAGSRALLPADPARVAERLNDLAAVDFALGDFAAATGRLEEAVALQRVAAGPGGRSPELATSLNNLGLAQLQLGRTDAARAWLEEALAQRRQLLPATHRDLAQTLANLGVLLQGAGELERAGELLDEALRIRVAALGETHPQVAQARNNLALLQQDRGELEAAIAGFRGARASLHAQLPAGHALRAQADHNLGQALLEAGLREEARGLLESALAARRQALPAGHPHLAWTLVALGRLRLEEGADPQAQALLAEAAAIRSTLEADDWLRLEAELALAQARVQAGEVAARADVQRLATQLARHPGSLGRQGRRALARP